MTIAEFFVNLGVKGTDKAVQSIGNVKKGLEDVRSTGLATKAAIVGIVYGLERLTGMASARGMELQKFTNLTGLSADQLQRWQYAAMESGVSAQEMAGSIQSVQNSMTNMLLGKGAPEGMAMLAQRVGFDPARARDTFYVMEKLKEFAQKTKDNPDVANTILRSFGISDGTIQMLRTTKVELDKIGKGNIFTTSQIAELARVEAAWAKLYNTVKLFWGAIVANNGMTAVGTLMNAFRGLQTITNEVGKLTKAIPGLKTAFIGLAVVIGGAFAPITTAVLGVIYLLSEFQKWKTGKANMFSNLGDFVSKYLFKQDDKEFDRQMQSGWHPPMALPSQGANTNSQNANVTVNNYGVKDAKDAGSIFRQELNNAFRQSSAIGQGN